MDSDCTFWNRSNALGSGQFCGFMMPLIIGVNVGLVKSVEQHEGVWTMQVQTRRHVCEVDVIGQLSSHDFDDVPAP